MLLGTVPNNNTPQNTELLVLQLIMQGSYAEAYELLINQQPSGTAVLYNIALCLHWSENYQEAIDCLEQIHLDRYPIIENKLGADIGYKKIRTRQNQTADYLNAISERYLKHFPVLVHDAIIRLKTDCWLRLGNFQKVIAIASPIAHKGFKDINDALNLAKASNDHTIR
ncbi:MAG: CDC27 family protein [Pedobacter sp.]